MANITITINLGNDDMQTGSDVAWALEQYAKIVRADFQDEQITDDADHKIKDISGNTVGEAVFTADADEDEHPDVDSVETIVDRMWDEA